MQTYSAFFWTNNFTFYLLCIFLHQNLSTAAQAQASPSKNAIVTADCKFNYSDDSATNNLTLQRARARIMDSQKTQFERSECGQSAAIDALPFFDCGYCQKEVIGLFKDAAKMQRESALEYKSDQLSYISFLNDEIKIRVNLNLYFNNHSDLIELQKVNLAEIADAYERTERGMEFHQYASAQSGKDAFGVTPFVVWAKAIRSCSDWNFNAGKNRISTIQLRNAICVSACQSEYKKIESALKNSSDPNISNEVHAFIPAKLCEEI